MPTRLSPCRSIKSVVLSVVAGSLLLVLLLSQQSQPPHFLESLSNELVDAVSAGANGVGIKTGRPVCSQLPGADDVLVIMKTGATEAHSKVPPHFSTTFSCTPHYAIFSDLAEEIEGFRVHDVLTELDSSFVGEDEQFLFYRKLQDYRKGGKNISALAESGIKENNDAWRLDKWKSLPMIPAAFKLRPEAKWFVFMDADTYVVWTNILQMLQRFDPSEPHYIGGQTWMGDEKHMFGHGGSGYILSREAMRMASEVITKEPERMRNTMTELCCGDYSVSIVLAELGIKLTPSWPTIQGETPETLDYRREPVFCAPVGTYHHVDAQQIRLLFDFEQEWISRKGPTTRILHRDIFSKYYTSALASQAQSKPQLKSTTPTLNNWTNLADQTIYDSTTAGHDYTQEEFNATFTVQGCRAICQKDAECVTFLHRRNWCATSKALKVGRAADVGMSAARKGEWTSGWIRERVDMFVRQREGCDGGWVV